MNVLKVVGGIFAGVGIGLLGLTTWLGWREMAFRRHSVTVSGRVVAMEHVRGGAVPVVEMALPEGGTHVFSGSVISNPPAHSVGEGVEVIYPVGQPEKAQLKTFSEAWGGILIAGILGLVFAGAGVPIYAYVLRRAKRIAWVQAHGQRVVATVTEVCPDESVSMNGRNPWQIMAQWTDQSRNLVYEFKSESLWFDPREHVSETVEVLIDPADPKKAHWVDTSFLPTRA